MAPDPKAVLALAEDIVKAREHLAQLEAQWEALFSAGTSAALVLTSDAGRPAISRRADPESLASRLIALLDSDPLVHYTKDEIARALNEPADKVQRSINKLLFKKKIGSYHRGMYESIKSAA